MKRIILISSLLFSVAFTLTAKETTTIKYYGSKSGLFRPCKGDLVAVCKEITTEKLDITENSGPVPVQPLAVDDDVKQTDVTSGYAIIKYDGMEYVVPVSSINWEDGSIDPQKM